MSRETQNNERRGRRKGLIGIAALATAGALVVGLGYAYFSDTLSFGGSAQAGTLDITADSMTLTRTDGLTVDNWVTTGVDGNSFVGNLNPGDAFRLSGVVTNTGNKSAWIRSAISDMSAPGAIGGNIYVYAGESVPTQAQLLGASNTDALEALPGFVGTGTDLASAATPVGAKGTPAIIGGTGAYAETAESTVSGHDNTYDQKIEVYFDKAATNESQLGTVSLTATVQALQYRNNTTTPTEDAWSSVVTTPFTLG